jgi:hypothetical protein
MMVPVAGGMNKRGSYGSMADRVARSQSAEAAVPAADVPASAAPAAPVKHCWVTDDHGRLPALLLEWRRTASGFQGRVVRPVPDEDGWIVVEEWLPADRLTPA